jgi:hypothetical protein
MEHSRSVRQAYLLATIIGSTVAAPAAAVAQFVEPDVRVLYTLASDRPGDGFGFVADAIGDLDGDGASEIAIGALRNDAAGQLAGKVFVYSGRDGTLLNTVTGSPFDRLGHGVAGVGDVNRDGVPDYAVTGPGPLPSSGLASNGRLLVISGATHTTLIDKEGPTLQSFFGYDVAAAGDIDGDQHADIMVGAPFHFINGAGSGSVQFVSGKDGTTLRSVVAPQPGISFGSAVSSVADQDQDGRPDHAVGAMHAGPSRGGLAYVLSSRTGKIIRTLEPRQKSAQQFGDFFVHDAGDVDGDGKGDIFVSDYADTRAGPGSGLGYVFYGGRDDRRVFRPEASGDGFGPGRGAGDVDGDGHDDLVIAAYTSSAGAPAGGKMFVISGRNGKVIRTATGNVPGALLGFDALAVGDVNGDGRIDFLLTGGAIAHLILGNP